MSTTTYPEFNNLSQEEIQARLMAFDSLIDNQMAKEYENAQREKEWLQKQQLVTTEQSSNKIEMPDEFWIIAHRGWSGSYPENTLI